MMAPKTKVLLLSFFISLFISLQITTLSAHAESINFGSDIDITELTLAPGETRAVKLTLMNLGENDLMIDLENNDISPLKVNIVPESIIINSKQTASSSTSVSKWYLLADGVTHVPIYNAQIYIQAPYDLYQTEVHDYNLIITLNAKIYAKEDTSGITEKITQSRQYNILVHPSSTFVSHIKTVEDKIDLNYKKTTPAQSLSTEKTGDEESSVIYINSSSQLDSDSSDNKNSNDAKSGKLLTVKKDTSEGTNDSSSNNATYVLIILCIIAIIAALLI